MVTEEMMGFIREARSGGMTDAELTQLLLTEGGWDQVDIDEAFRGLNASNVSSILPPYSPESVVTTVAKAEPPAPLPDQTVSVRPLTPPAVSQASLSQSFGRTPPEPLATESGEVSAPAILPKVAALAQTTVSPQAPTTFPTVSHPSISAAVTPPSVSAPLATSPRKENTQVIEGTPPNTSADRNLARPKMPHDQFDALFGDKTGKASPPPQSPNTKESKYRETLSPNIDRGATAIERSTTPPSIKEQQSSWSIGNLLGRDKAVTPSTPPLQEKTASIPPALGASATPPHIKFDLSSALRQSAFSSASAPVPVTNILLPQIAPLEKKATLPAFDVFSGRAEKNSVPPPIATHAPLPTNASAPPSEGGERKKVVLSAKRTMSLDLLRGTKTDLPPVSLPRTTAKESARVISSPSQETKDPSSASAPLFPDDVARRKKITRLVMIVLGAILLLGLLGGGVFAFMKMRTEDPEALLSAAFAQFFQSSAFAYNGEVSTDFTLTSLPGSERENGLVKFSMKFGGKLASDVKGYGDGAHKITFEGGWQTGTSTFGTAVESDIVIIKDEFYFNILSIPPESELDPEVLRANWVKVNLADIARELEFAGTPQGEEEYGSFGGTAGELSLKALLERSSFIRAMEKPVREDRGGTMALRTRVTVDPDRLAELSRALYRRYANNDLAFTEEELLRFKGALAKLSGDVWTDATTGALIAVTLRADFDDDIADVHVKGPLVLTFNFTSIGEPPLFGTPTPVVSLSELRTQMDESIKLRSLRARDELTVGQMTLLTQSLKAYYEEKGRYPKELSELYSAKKLSESSITSGALKDYHYRSYLKSGTYTKAGQCATTGKICAFYHLGANLLDPKNALLGSDADQTTAILGADGAGCGGEKNVSCYDVVAPPLVNTTSSASPTAPAPSI